MRHKLWAFWVKHRAEMVLGFFILITIVGLVLFARGWQYMLALTPFYLSLLTISTLYFWHSESTAKLKAAIAILLLGFFSEVIGVHTGLLFGDYTYGKVMGVTLFGVPLMISATWLLVTMSAWQISHLRALKTWQHYLLGGSLVVMFDLILEQFAVAYGLWTWADQKVPVYNYICWFVVSVICFWIYQRLTPHTRPSLFIVGILPLMSVFFWVMLLFV